MSLQRDPVEVSWAQSGARSVAGLDVWTSLEARPRVKPRLPSLVKPKQPLPCLTQLGREAWVRPPSTASNSLKDLELDSESLTRSLPPLNGNNSPGPSHLVVCRGSRARSSRGLFPWSVKPGASASSVPGIMLGQHNQHTRKERFPLQVLARHLSPARFPSTQWEKRRMNQTDIRRLQEFSLFIN